MDTSHVGGCFSDCLFGVCTEGFVACNARTGMAVGNDAFSWGVCGNRLEKIHNDVEMSFGSMWKNGDVIGFAVDMRNPSGAVMRVSVNGSFKSPNGVAFNIDARYLSPAFSAASGFFRVNFGVQPFLHSPPDAGAGYVSVQEFARLNPSDHRKLYEDPVGLFLCRGAGCSSRRLYSLIP
jgi:hypothetical protein